MPAVTPVLDSDARSAYPESGGAGPALPFDRASRDDPADRLALDDLADDPVEGPAERQAWLRLGWLRTSATTVGFALAYFTAGVIGRLTAPDHGQVVLAAPAAGVAVVWLLVSRRRAVDLVILAAVAAGTHALTLADRTAVPLHVSVALVQTLVAVTLLRQLVPDPYLRERRDAPVSTRMVWRCLLALLLAAASGATILVLGLASGIAPELDDVATWISFLGRNLTSMTVLVILAYLLALRDRAVRWARVSTTEGVGAGEALLVLAVTTVVYVTVFVVSGLPLAFLTMLVVLWVASRSTPLVATLHATASGIGAILMTTLGYGPFDGVDDPVMRAGVLQMLVFALFLTALVVSVERQQEAAASKELRRERQRAEDQSQLLTAVLESLSEAVLVLGADGAPTLANGPGRRYLALREETVRRTGLHGLHDADGKALAPDQLPSVRALRGEEVPSVNVSLRDAAGELHVHAVTAVPLRTGDRDRAAAVVVHRDVTEVRAQQDRLSAYAGIVAHDLKNPLASIATWAELLELELSDHLCSRTPDGTGVPEAGDALRGITRASRRMALLIDRLLTRARSESTVLQLGVVDLEAAVARVAAERRLGGAVTVPATMPLARADELLVSQLLDNLVGNAAKYVAPGTAPRITVTGTQVEDEVEVRVTDNGIGIPPAERPRVFEEFHRSHSDGGYEGTGLGLAICRVIVERHGGRIDVTEGPGGTGSCFRFTLPAATLH